MHVIAVYITKNYNNQHVGQNMTTPQTRSTVALLASSLLLTIGRGATLPFMTIYLNRQYGMAVDQVGYAMSVALTIGVVFSLGFGMLADKFDKKRYMLLAIVAFITGFAAIPLTHHAGLVVLFFALINCAYSVFSTVLKAYFADTLTPTAKAKVFSLNYTFLNIGWTVGPPLGTLLVMQSINLPFWLAAVCAAFPLVFIQFFVRRVAVGSGMEPAVPWSPSVLLKDKALGWFTLSNLLASFVCGSFASCLSQYVMAVADSDFAEKSGGRRAAGQRRYRGFAAIRCRAQTDRDQPASAHGVRHTLLRGGAGGIYALRQQLMVVGALRRGIYAGRSDLCAR